MDGSTCGTRKILATTALTATTGFGPLNIAGNLTVTGTISTASTIYANNFYTASSFPVTLSGVCVISNNICATGNICGGTLYSGGAQVCTSVTVPTSYNTLSAVNLSATNAFVNVLSTFSLSATNVYSSNTINLNLNHLTTNYGTVNNVTYSSVSGTVTISLSSTTPGTGFQFGESLGSVINLYNNGTPWTTSDANFFNNINGVVLYAHDSSSGTRYAITPTTNPNIVTGSTDAYYFSYSGTPGPSPGFFADMDAFYYNGTVVTTYTNLTANQNVQSLSANSYYNITNGITNASTNTTFAGNTLTFNPSATVNVGNSLFVYNSNSAINAVNPNATQVLQTGILAFNYNGINGWLLSGGNLNVVGSISATAPYICGCTTSCNSSIGYQALKCNVSGYSNTAVGVCALYCNCTGYSNVAVGNAALNNNTSGYNNVAIGQSSLYCSTGACGYLNLAVGNFALYSNLCYHNTAIGHNTLFSSTSGIYNVAVGGQALVSNTCGKNNTAVGYQADINNNTGCYRIAIGCGAAPTTNCTGHTVWGNSNNNVCNCVYASWSTVSDCRDKTNITPLPTNLGLEFVKQLKPVTYNWDNRQTYVRECNFPYGQKDGTLASEKQHYGFIAQELKTVVDSLSAKFDGLGYDETQDAYRLTYEELIAPVVAAIKELDAYYASIEARLSVLENK